jgi:hypothetical protein
MENNTSSNHSADAPRRMLVRDVLAAARRRGMSLTAPAITNRIRRGKLPAVFVAPGPTNPIGYWVVDAECAERYLDELAAKRARLIVGGRDGE